MTEEKSERKEPAKKGLHGWKAAVTVFGCGTLAAFGVFGVIVGVISFLLGTISSGVNPSVNAPGVPDQMAGEPVEDLDPGELNICEQDVQYSHGQHDSNYVSSNYDDPALRGEKKDRTIKDECSWEVYPAGESVYEPWEFTYSYEAVVTAPGGRDPQAVASQGYDELMDELPGEFHVLHGSGEAEISEKSFYYHGEGVGGEYIYFLLGQTRSTFYLINFVSPEANGEVSSTRFTNEARSIASMVEPALTVLVPD